jgi:hypothetical protein
VIWLLYRAVMDNSMKIRLERVSLAVRLSSLMGRRAYPARATFITIWSKAAAKDVTKLANSALTVPHADRIANLAISTTESQASVPCARRDRIMTFSKQYVPLAQIIVRSATTKGFVIAVRRDSCIGTENA